MADDMLRQFRPPINRAMRNLDKAFFCRDVPSSAARVPNPQKISSVLKELRSGKLVPDLRHFSQVRDDPEGPAGRKCVVLNPTIVWNDESTWPQKLSEKVTRGDVSLIPYTLTLDYDYYSAWEILECILPEEVHDEIPTSYNQAGHVAHLNLRDQYLPYKYLIGEVILSKGSGVRTVINKAETLGAENEFRVLDYELLAGENNLKTELREAGCLFRFDYAKVFWNSKLQTEHTRLIETFKPGEVVCDAMAGVGPFAVPAGKQEVFAWANDLNPDCYDALEVAIKLNKVTGYVEGFNEDAHSFIRTSAQRLLNSDRFIKIPNKLNRHRKGNQKQPPYVVVERPSVFSHYVMNLPSTAINFLSDFIGLYAGHEELFQPQGSNKLPMIHCYCFGLKAADAEADLEARKDVCRQISAKIGHEISLDHEDTNLWDVRDVAPSKRQFCASFRLPAEIAFKQI